MYQKDKLRLWLIGMATLFLSVGSIFIYRSMNRALEQRKEIDLSKVLDLVTVGINDKVTTAVGLLYDLKGLMVLDGISPKIWENFILETELELRHPGVYSLAYVQSVPKETLMEYEQVMRSIGGEKYRNYTVFPKTNSSEFLPVKFLHSMDPEVNILLGFDFRYSEKSIKTFTDALQKNQPTMSELLHLSVVIPKSKQVGYEIVLPVYKDATMRTSPGLESNKVLTGFVGVWITPENLRNKQIDMTGLRYTVYDNGEKLITVGTVGETKASVSKEVQILNRKLQIVLDSDSNFVVPGIEEYLPLITLAGLTLVVLLWSLSVYSILSARRQAINLATITSKDLRKFKQAVEGVSDHVIITDPKGVIIYANKAATQITGYSFEEMLGKRPNLWGGQMSKEFYENFWRIISVEKKPFSGELVNKRKNGELYETNLTASPILDEKGALLFLVGIERDLSRYKAVEKMKTEFISLASHQLRTPLSAVKWFGEMLMDGDAGKLNEDQKKFVAKINESNEREIQLVNALLNVSRIESGKIVIIPKPTKLKEFVEDILTEIKVGLVGQKKELVYKVGEDLPEIRIDVDLIKHVYINLLTNAIKYTGTNGKIAVNVYKEGGEIITEIKDNGIGIPEEEQKRISDKFFRGSNALKKETDGSGLGLYLTKTIVESSGGKLWFESEEGKGSTFTFSLPIKSPPAKSV